MSTAQPNSASPQVPEWCVKAADEIRDNGVPTWPGWNRYTAAAIIARHAPQRATAGERVRLRATIEDVIRVESNYSEDIDSSLVASLTERIINLMADATAGLAKRVKELEAEYDASIRAANNHFTLLHVRISEVTAERDAALAKVGELERELKESDEAARNMDAGAKMRTNCITALEAEVARLRNALEMGQANCDDVYEDLRTERDDLRAQLAPFTDIVKNVNAHRGRDSRKMIVPKDAEGRAVYWKARAKAAEGELAKTLTDILDYEAKQLTRPAQGSVELLATIRAIKAEAERCGEYNPCSGKTRLPKGYQQIISLCESALTPATEGKR